MKCIECGGNCRLASPPPIAHAECWDCVGLLFFQCESCEWYQWCPGTSPNLVMGRAQGGIRFEMDGNMVCAKRHDFVDLMQSHAGFGTDKRAAADELHLVEREERDHCRVCAGSGMIEDNAGCKACDGTGWRTNP